MEDVNPVPGDVFAFWQPQRLLFRYYRDHYAAILLEDVLRPHLPLGELRKGRYGRLLDRPALKVLAASKGSGVLHRDDLQALWPCQVQTYRLSFGVWGADTQRARRRNQTSRPGRQLVMQLNFSREHDAEYQRLIFNAKERPFVNRRHPVNQSGRNTMAWARIDLDLHSGEALIEEVQNDWIRKAGWCLANAALGRGKFKERRAREDLAVYVGSVLAPHAAIWSEATLSAALHLLGPVFGMRRIWFHSFATGCEIKRLKDFIPPRSLYTDLPKKFCFELTSDVPEFILPAQPRWLRRKLERGEGRFWRMDR